MKKPTNFIRFLQKELGGNDVCKFVFQSLLAIFWNLKNGDKRIDCTPPPTSCPGTAFASVMIKAEVPEAEKTAERLNGLILLSQKILPNHPVNLKRVQQGKDMANSIWPWSPGYKPKMETLQQRYGIQSGAVISAVDLIKGIGVYAGLEIIEVEGATGLYTTNYEGKADAALTALKKHDLYICISKQAMKQGMKVT